MLPPKITTFRFFDVKASLSGPTLFSLREFEIVVAAFLVKYVVAAMVDKNLVDNDVAVYVDDLVAVVTAAVAVAACSR